MKFLWVTAIFLLINPYNSSGNISFTHNGHVLSEVEQAEFLLPFPGIKMIDTVKFNKLINDLDQKVYRAPVNAVLDDNGNIIAEKSGYRLDRATFIDRSAASFFYGKPSVVRVPVQSLYPKVDSELLSQIREKRIGQYVTYFNGNNKPRIHNLTLAAKAINNYVVMPGETFSFNQVVGKRTAEKGYLRAPVIVKGELAEGIGGGICQVSSTLFNAVDHAGIRIVQRFSHSKRVPYVPSGRDATVSWYGPDFRFQNKYNQPILIRTKVGYGSLAITIYSSETLQYQSKMIPGMTRALPREIKVRKKL
ncbi:VanW family protein [Peribacillus glennii]|uniref:Peptidoglycan binding domain-containing protein n=1 Tax=Peribacillus glennii TaxID=2303991 RepID=A0A372LGJ5_9BACI|nr:VanW family protein [Peribacillus glennii]RFU64726.1 hypothetical protein D0466_02025 [Peribacillus glennii]